MYNVTYDDVLRRDTEGLLSTVLSQTVGNREFLERMTSNGNNFCQTLIDVMNTKTSYTLSSELFTTIYQNVKDYIDNVSNVDLCKTDALQSLLSYYSEHYSLFDYINDIPIELKNLIDLFSINRYHLLDKNNGILNSDIKQNIYSQISVSPIDYSSGPLTDAGLEIQYASIAELQSMKAYMRSHIISADASTAKFQVDKLSVLNDIPRYYNAYDALVNGLSVGISAVDHNTSISQLSGISSEISSRIESVIPPSLLNVDNTHDYIIQELTHLSSVSQEQWKRDSISCIIPFIDDSTVSGFVGHYQTYKTAPNTSYDINLLEIYKNTENRGVIFKLYVNPESEFILSSPGFTSYEQFIAYVLSSENSVSTALITNGDTSLYSLSNDMMFFDVHVDDKSTEGIDTDKTWLMKLDVQRLIEDGGYNISSNDMLMSSDSSAFMTYRYANIKYLTDSVNTNIDNFIDETKYKDIIVQLFYRLLVDSLELKYISGDYIYKNIDTAVVNETDANSIKAKYNVSFTFDQNEAVDNIDNGISSLTDYSEAEQKVIEYEISKRARAGNISVKNSRFAYYREAYVKSFIQTVESLYNNTNSLHLNLYDVDKNYFDLKNQTTVSVIKEENGQKTLDYDIIMNVAQILMTMTMMISSIREKMKTLIERNSIRGTYLIVLLYVIEYIRQLSLQSYSGSTIDLSFNNIKLTEYIDPTEYYNIKNENTHYTTEQSLKINERYWENDSMGSIQYSTISSLYVKLLHLSEVESDNFDIDSFIKTVLQTGANSYYDISGNPNYDNGNMIISTNISAWLKADISNALSNIPTYMIDPTILSNHVSTFNMTTDHMTSYDKTDALSVYSRYIYSNNDIANSIYNVKNTVHPSYQIHTNIFDLFEYNEVKHAIENYFHKYIPNSYESIVSAEIDEYVGPLGQINNIWKYDSFDFTGYSSRYEIETNTTDFLTESKYVDRDGAFIEDAVSSYLENPTSFISSLQAGTNEYYAHINMSKTQREDICSKLTKWYDYINTILRRYNDKYEIYDYAIDINGNFLSLYKPTAKMPDNVKQNVLGTLWIRLKDHPISFPAFNLHYSDGIHLNMSHYPYSGEMSLSPDAQYYNKNNEYVSAIDDKQTFPVGFYHFDLSRSLQNLYLFAPLKGHTSSDGLKNSRMIFGDLVKVKDSNTNSFYFTYKSDSSYVDEITSPNIKKSEYQHNWAEYLGLFKDGLKTYAFYADKYRGSNGKVTLYKTSGLTDTYTVSLRITEIDHKQQTTSQAYVEIPNLIYNLHEDTDIIMTNDENSLISFSYVGNESIDTIVTNYPEYDNNQISTFNEISIAISADPTVCFGLEEYPQKDPTSEVITLNNYIVAFDLMLLNGNFTLVNNIQYYNLNADIGFIPNYANDIGKMQLWKSRYLSQLSSWNIQMVGDATAYKNIDDINLDLGKSDSKLNTTTTDNGIRWSQYPLVVDLTSNSVPLGEIVADNDKTTISTLLLSSNLPYDPYNMSFNDIRSYSISGASYVSGLNMISVDATQYYKSISAAVLYSTNSINASDSYISSMTFNNDKMFNYNVELSGVKSTDAFCYNIYNIVNELPYVIDIGVINSGQHIDYYGKQIKPEFLISGYSIQNLSEAFTKSKSYIDNVSSITVSSTYNLQSTTANIGISVELHFENDKPTGWTSPTLSIEVIKNVKATYAEYEKYHLLQISSEPSSVSDIYFDSIKSPLDYKYLSGGDATIAFKWQADKIVSNISSNYFPPIDITNINNTALFKYSQNLNQSHVVNPNDIFIVDCMKFNPRIVSVEYYHDNGILTAWLSTSQDMISGCYSYIDNDQTNLIQLYFNYPHDNSHQFVNQIQKYCNCYVNPNESKAIGLFNQITTQSSQPNVYNNTLVYVGSYLITNTSDHNPKYIIRPLDISSFVNYTDMKTDSFMSSYVNSFLSSGIISAPELSISF